MEALEDTARICAGLHEDGWRLVLGKLDEPTIAAIREAVAAMFDECARTMRRPLATAAAAGD